MTHAPDTSAATHADWARALHERQIAISGELAEDGLEITKHLKAEILAAPADEATQATVMAYGRAARSVRLSLMLQARLIGDLEARDGGRAGVTGDGPRDPLYRIERIIIDPADRETEGAETSERLTGEGCERLDREDFRRFGEPAGFICQGPDVKDDAPFKSSPVGGGGPSERSVAWGRGSLSCRRALAERPPPPLRGPPPSLPSGGPRSGATRGGEEFKAPS
jgi:hypothetical protein